jgi:hypothetical protein
MGSPLGDGTQEPLRRTANNGSCLTLWEGKSRSSSQGCAGWLPEATQSQRDTTACNGPRPSPKRGHLNVAAIQDQADEAGCRHISWKLALSSCSSRPSRGWRSTSGSWPTVSRRRVRGIDHGTRRVPQLDPDPRGADVEPAFLRGRIAHARRRDPNRCSPGRARS